MVNGSITRKGITLCFKTIVVAASKSTIDWSISGTMSAMAVSGTGHPFFKERAFLTNKVGLTVLRLS